jgi:hypothetical protein
MHVRAVAEVPARPEIDVAERLEVGDPVRAEPVLLRRGEAEEELGAVRDEVGAGHVRGEGHPLREPAAGESLADTCHPEDVQVVEERGRARDDVCPLVGAQEDGDIVVLEDRLRRIAREADRVEQSRLACTAVERKVRLGLARDVVAEVRQPPTDRDAEPGRRRGIEAALELHERVLELAGRLPWIGRGDVRGHEAVVARRHDDLDVVVDDDGEPERVLIRAHPPGGPAQRLGGPPITGQPVDELVDARGTERARRGAREGLPPGQAHLSLPAGGRARGRAASGRGSGAPSSRSREERRAR